MMNLLLRIDSAFGSMTASEKKAAEYLKDHLADVLTMNLAQLAQAAGVGSATIVRLLKKLDINNYTRLKIIISSEQNQKRQTVQQDLDVRPNDSFTHIRDQLVANATISVRQTADLLNEKESIRVIKQLNHTRTLYVYGAGASYLAAINIMQKWSRIGMNVVCNDDMNVFVPLLTNAQPTDAIWLISNSGRTPELIFLAKFCQERKIPVISLTMFGENAVSKLSTYPLHTIKPVEPKVRIGATSSITSQFAVIDILFYLFVSTNFSEVVPAIEASNAAARDYKSHFKV
jgi:DNA-binding MurR/RpiR family transcriptional regulator